MASGRHRMNIPAALAYLMYCSCVHLMLLPNSATAHAISTTAPARQRLRAHDDRNKLHTNDRFDSVHLSQQAQNARSLEEPGDQHRPNHALSAPAAEGDLSGLGHRGVPQLSPRPRTADASPQPRPRRGQQRHYADLHTGGAAEFVVEDAVVTGLASAELQAALHAEYDADAYDDFDGVSEAAGGTGSSRSLLQRRRKRRPAKYAKCSRCSVTRCDRTKCSGRCRRNRKLFECRTTPLSRTSAFCRPDANVTVTQTEIPVSDLSPFSSLEVTAPSPYIGCALIADRNARLSGCPAPGTPGRMNVPGRSVPVDFVVGTSTCAFQRYDPICAPGCGSGCGPNHPFGICLCSRVALRGRSLPAGPCDITELDIVNAPPERGEEDIVIESRGSVTSTMYSDYNEISLLVARYQQSISEESLMESIDSMPELFEGVSDVSVELGGAIEVTLEKFDTDVGEAYAEDVYELPVEAQVAIDEDYYDDTDEPRVGRALRVRRESVRVPFKGVLPPACDPDQFFRRPVPYFYDYDCSSYDYDYEYQLVEYYL